MYTMGGNSFVISMMQPLTSSKFASPLLVDGIVRCGWGSGAVVLCGGRTLGGSPGGSCAKLARVRHNTRWSFDELEP